MVTKNLTPDSFAEKCIHKNMSGIDAVIFASLTLLIFSAVWISYLRQTTWDPPTKIFNSHSGGIVVCTIEQRAVPIRESDGWIVASAIMDGKVQNVFWNTKTNRLVAENNCIVVQVKE